MPRPGGRTWDLSKTFFIWHCYNNLGLGEVQVFELCACISHSLIDVDPCRGDSLPVGMVGKVGMVGSAHCCQSAPLLKARICHFLIVQVQCLRRYSFDTLS